MNRTNIIIVIVVVIVIALIGLIGVLKKQFLPKYKWFASYHYKSEEPYGTKLLYELLEDKYSNDDFKMLNKKPARIIGDKETNSLIFYIGYKTMYDSITIEWFKDYMNKGNKICIASDYLPYQLLNNIYDMDSALFLTHSFESETIETSFLDEADKKYKFHHQYLKDTTDFQWLFFADTTINDYWRKYLYNPISEIDSNRVNFLEIEYGEGGLYILTTPLLLTNYYLITEKGFAYTNKFFSSLGDVDKIYWDNFSRIPEMFNRKRNSINLNNPLEFIMENSALRWGWYIFIIGIILFAMFRLKRRQASIEIITPDKNTTIEYAKAVGILHYKASDYKTQADQLIKLFYNYVNNRYGIAQNMEKEEQIDKITLQSGLKRNFVESIFKSYIKLKYNPDPEVSQLIKLHSDLEFFYKNRK